jgi:hypothetical protein
MRFQDRLDVGREGFGTRIELVEAGIEGSQQRPVGKAFLHGGDFASSITVAVEHTAKNYKP